eukprot:ANDGO_00334.mRNA.1 hypothetical protein NAEGRDRAFT_65873
MASYKPVTRVGNWAEEQSLQDLQLTTFLKARDAGCLPAQKLADHRSQHQAFVQVSTSSDGNLHYGDTILLMSAETSGFVASDFSDPPECQRELAAAVTTTAVAEFPMKRCAFVVVPYSKEAAPGSPSASAGLAPIDKDGQPVRFGDLVTLRSVLTPESVLFSQRQSALSFARVSHAQEVFLAPFPSRYEAAWQFIFADPSYRVEMEGEIVRVNVPVILQHAATRQLLCSSTSVRYPNTFGREYEVCCAIKKNVHKVEEKCHVFIPVAQADAPSQQQ